ncbi:bifunctional 3,4-dihydroxy-2-butanone-4-phosphate synthase/GTP cyclohydrolase II [Chitinivibrio alkaliphilus]|uniref:Riboflavin biosynthesis protein RibBA n=1 Tax=Chitinivibrio alkaliphilus ACht1 TaxID=1313304 RepID=U7D6U4_9BACT|nr:bifunctional 3,4-dihydroxy-2-butanone-4-phosphate synthase/GTP cyclohydrolase II [Chitinivibrio alkaliphilus]ERP38685.1 3,4-dihydroxy-2-butanone 4-phosphate synthase [Chitinivibrio alkaliphilus ACht1]
MKSLEEIQAIIEVYKQGGMVIIVDDEDRENEGDLAYAGQFSTPEKVNFMARYGRGLICAACDAPVIERLQLPMMTSNNTAYLETAFTVSVEAREGTTTGISAEDRSTTILALSDPNSTHADFVIPGHMFPLKAKPGGVLQRIGQTEGSVDLAKLAGLEPVAVICEIMNEDGTMARRPELDEFSHTHSIPIISVADIVRYRRRTETLIVQSAEANMPTSHGEFRIRAYEDTLSGKTHVALFIGDISSGEPVITRMHSECLTGDVLGSLRCDCGNQLAHAMEQVSREGRGVVIYLRQEGRGIGLANKIKAYGLQDDGYDTVEANHELGFEDDLRDYGIGAQILNELGVEKIRLLTNNMRKVVGLEGYGIEIVERLPIVTEECEHNRAYLSTKRDKLGHLFVDEKEQEESVENVEESSQDDDRSDLAGFGLETL